MSTTQKKAPAYTQVKSFVQARIASGKWRPGDPVPTEAELMQQFGVSRMTVHRALRELATEGLVTRVQGSGTRVAHLGRVSSRLIIRDIDEEVVERGHVHSTVVVYVALEKGVSAVVRQFRLRAGAKVFHTILVHLENGVAVQYEDRYVNPAAAPGYLGNDFAKVSPTLYLLQHAPITEASYSIEACLPTGEEARHLGIRRSEPCLAMSRRTVSGPNVASTARMVYPGSRYSFAGQFQV